jgi:hypothetical protein
VPRPGRQRRASRRRVTGACQPTTIARDLPQVTIARAEAPSEVSTCQRPFLCPLVRPLTPAALLGSRGEGTALQGATYHDGVDRRRTREARWLRRRRRTPGPRHCASTPRWR